MEDIYMQITQKSFDDKINDIETLNSEDILDVCEIDREFTSIINIENIRLK